MERTLIRSAGLYVAVVALAVAGLPLSAAADGGGAVTLPSLMEAGRRYHPTLAKQPLLAKSLLVSESQLDRAYWPQLSLTGQASWQSDVTRVQIPIPGASVPTLPKDQYRFALELQQNLWDGGMTADQKRVARRRSQVEQGRVAVEWYQVRDRILQLYFVGLVQQELESQAIALQGYLATVIDKAELALQRGLLTERDVLLARARQLEARQAATDAAAQLGSIRASLQSLTGTTLSEDATLMPAVTACSEGDAHAVTPDGVKRPELDVLSAQSELLSAQEQLDLAPDRARIGAFATAGYGRPGLNMLNPDFDTYFIGGLRVTVPLTYLYAGTHSKARQQLSIQRALIARQRDALMTQINIQLDAQRAELSRLDATIALDTDLLTLREGAREQTERQLALGTATMTDLVGDLSLEDEARTRLAIHHTQRNQTCHRVAFIVGNL